MSRLQTHVNDFQDAALVTGVTLVVGTRLMANAAGRIALEVGAIGLSKVGASAHRVAFWADSKAEKLETPQMALDAKNLGHDFKRMARGIFGRKAVPQCATA